MKTQRVIVGRFLDGVGDFIIILCYIRCLIRLSSLIRLSKGLKKISARVDETCTLYANRIER